MGCPAQGQDFPKKMSFLRITYCPSPSIPPSATLRGTGFSLCLAFNLLKLTLILLTPAQYMYSSTTCDGFALDIQQGKGYQDLVVSLIAAFFSFTIFNCRSLIKKEEENLVIWSKLTQTIWSKLTQTPGPSSFLIFKQCWRNGPVPMLQ